MKIEFNIMRARKAFTLIEIMVVVIAVGILLSMMVLSFGKVKQSMEDKGAIHQAEILESAKNAYAFEVRDAETNYGAAGDDQARYALIRDRIPDAPINLSDLANGYTFAMGSTVSSSVSITRDDDGSSLSY